MKLSPFSNGCCLDVIIQKCYSCHSTWLMIRAMNLKVAEEILEVGDGNRSLIFILELRVTESTNLEASFFFWTQCHM